MGIQIFFQMTAIHLFCLCNTIKKPLACMMDDNISNFCVIFQEEPEAILQGAFLPWQIYFFFVLFCFIKTRPIFSIPKKRWSQLYVKLQLLIF